MEWNKIQRNVMQFDAMQYNKAGYKSFFKEIQ